MRPQVALEFRNARLIFPQEVRKTSLRIADGFITSIDRSADDAQVIDCAGDYIAPGLIELHSDNFERHAEPRPGVHWSAVQAVFPHDAELATAGITTAFYGVTLGNDLNESYLDEIKARSNAATTGLQRVDHRYHFRCELSSPRFAEQLGNALNHAQPAMVSLMNHTPGQGQWRDLERFRKHYMARYGLTAQQLNELTEARRQSAAQYGKSNRQLALEAAARCRSALASHDDSTVADVESARAVGCTIAEFPTSLQAASAAHEQGLAVVAGAPNLVSGGSHSGNVSAGDLVRAGLCDILSSDYCPHRLLQAAFLLARDFDFSLPQAVATVTSTPASAVGLSDRGRIETGKRADLIRVRENQTGFVLISAWCAGRQIA